MRKVYVDGGFVIMEATPPYLSNWSILDAPDGIPIDRLVVVDGVVVERVEELPLPPPLPPAPPPLIPAEVIDRCKERLLGLPLANVDIRLVTALSLLLSLHNSGHSELAHYTLERLDEYLDTTM